MIRRHGPLFGGIKSLEFDIFFIFYLFIYLFIFFGGGGGRGRKRGIHKMHFFGDYNLISLF